MGNDPGVISAPRHESTTDLFKREALKERKKISMQDFVNPPMCLSTSGSLSGHW